MRNIVFEALCATLDELSIGFVACFADGRVLHANRAAEEMLACGSPIGMRHGQIQGCDRKGTERLLEGLREVAGEASVRHSQNICRDICLFGTDDGKGAALATLKPLIPPAGEFDCDECVVAIFITQTKTIGIKGLPGIADCFDLTPAETRILEQFIEGGSVAEVARALEISPNTVKTHLQSIFSKTRASRQTELIRLVSALRPPLREGTSQGLARARPSAIHRFADQKGHGAIASA